MIYRAFRRTDTGQWLDCLFTTAGNEYPADPTEQAADLASALSVAPDVLEHTDAPSDPRSGTLAALPVTPPTDEEQAQTQMEQLRAKAKAVFAGTDTFTAAQMQKILAGLVLRATR